MADVKCVRIEMEYDNGLIERAEGADASAIADSINGAFALRQIHGMPYDGPKLKPVDRSISTPEPARVDERFEKWWQETEVAGGRRATVTIEVFKEGTRMAWEAALSALDSRSEPTPATNKDWSVNNALRAAAITVEERAKQWSGEGTPGATPTSIDIRAELMNAASVIRKLVGHDHAPTPAPSDAPEELRRALAEPLLTCECVAGSDGRFRTPSGEEAVRILDAIMPLLERKR